MDPVERIKEINKKYIGYLAENTTYTTDIYVVPKQTFEYLEPLKRLSSVPSAPEKLDKGIEIEIRVINKGTKKATFRFCQEILEEVERNHNTDSYKEIASTIAVELALLLKKDLNQSS